MDKVPRRVLRGFQMVLPEEQVIRELSSLRGWEFTKEEVKHLFIDEFTQFDGNVVIWVGVTS